MFAMCFVMLNVVYPLGINHNDCEYCFFICFRSILMYDIKITWCINIIELVIVVGVFLLHSSQNI
jgi:hypothetical protein